MINVLLNDQEIIPPESVRVVSCSLSEPSINLCSKFVLLHPHPSCLLASCVSEAEANTYCDVRTSCQIIEGIQQADLSSFPMLIVHTGARPLSISANTQVAIARVVELSEQVEVNSYDGAVNVFVHQVVYIESDMMGECGNVSDGNSDGVEPSKRDDVHKDLPDQQKESFVFPDGTSFDLPPGLSLDGLSAADAVMAARLIEAHVGAFSMSPYDLGYNDSIPHEIHLTDDKAINLPYRRVIPCQMAEVKKLLQDLLNRKVIRKSSSQYASPIVLVKKKDGQLRLCVDYRCLNSKRRFSLA